MKTLSCFLALATLPFVALTAQAGVERTVEKTFNVQPGGTLRVETSGGGIRVESSNDSVVKVVATKKFRTSSDSAADEVEKRLTLSIEQQGSDIVATAKYERDSFFEGSTPVYVNFVVTAPASFAANLKTSGGNITVGDLGGEVRARTSGGSISLGKMGGEVDASTSGGNVSLESAAASVKAHTSGGNITVGRVAGEADLGTSGGNIKIESVANTLHASTSGGSVYAAIAGPLKGDCDLRTSGGSVTAVVDKGSAFQLDASTSGGGVHADGLTITIDNGGAGRSRLSGAVNGGGPTLKLRTSGGSIHIKTR
jgi:hypothetical protein